MVCIYSTIALVIVMCLWLGPTSSPLEDVEFQSAGDGVEPLSLPMRQHPLPNI
jgi:hypothetical protein